MAEVFVTFLSTMTRHLTKVTEEGQFLLAHSLWVRVRFFMGQEQLLLWQQEPEVRRERALTLCRFLSFFLFFFFLLFFLFLIFLLSVVRTEVWPDIC